VQIVECPDKQTRSYEKNKTHRDCATTSNVLRATQRHAPSAILPCWHDIRAGGLNRWNETEEDAANIPN
jgi:hypothetical protein